MNRVAKCLNVVVKWRRLLFWNSLVLTLLAVLVSLILPQRFAATAQLLPPSDEGDAYGVAGVLSGGLSSRLGKLRATALGGSGASDVTVAILHSRTLVRVVAERCSIARHYRIRPIRVDEIEKQLRSMTRVAAGEEGVVRISVEAKSPTLAANVANTYVVELDSFLRTSNISRGRNMRLFIERRLLQIDSGLAVGRESLLAFQQRTGVVTVDDETKAAIDVYAAMQSQLRVKDAQLEAARATANDQNPYTVRLQTEIAGLRQELRRFEHGGGAGFGVGFGVPFQRLPEVTAEFARRYQDFRIQQESYAALYQQYEYAKMLEVRDTPVLTVLDYAVPPQRRSFPRRVLIVGAVFGFSVAAGLGFVFASEYFEHIKLVRPEEYSSWRSLRGESSLVLRGVFSAFRKRRR